MKMNYFPDKKTLTPETAKEIYKSLTKRYHPDKTDGNNDIMAEINKEYATIIKYFDQKKKRMENLAEIIKTVEDKTLEGINAVKDNLEPELKKLAKEKAGNIIKNKVPTKYRSIAELILNKIITDADIVKLTSAGFAEIKKLINHKKTEKNENL